MDQDSLKRRSLIMGVGTAAAGFVVGASTACAQTPATEPSGFVPARHELDAWMDELPGQHRIFVDSATASGGAEALLYTNNLYNAQENAYSGSAADFALVVCFRHLSTPFGYNDDVWSKYGAVFQNVMNFQDPDTGGAPTRNLMNSADHTNLPNFGNTIGALVARGTQVAICNAATQFMAQQIANASGESADSVYEELVAGAVPGSRFVSAGVMALTRAQEYGYSLLYAG
jgi:intracellular sulfur oxidation DsrE/DsrF family protein